MGDDGQRDRSPRGTFTAEHTDDEIVAAVRAHEPAATSEVAGELGIQRQSAYYRLRRLRDAGRVSSKKIGASLVWFPAHDTTDTERRETPQEPADETPGPSGPEIDERHDAASSADVEDTAADTDDVGRKARERVEEWKPWSRVADDELAARRRAVLAAWRHLRDVEEATGGDLQDAAADAVDPADAGYKDASGMWGKSVRLALQDGDDTADLPGVEPPAERESYYHFHEPAEDE